MTTVFVLYCCNNKLPQTQWPEWHNLLSYSSIGPKCDKFLIRWKSMSVELHSFLKALSEKNSFLAHPTCYNFRTEVLCPCWVTNCRGYLHALAPSSLPPPSKSATVVWNPSPIWNLSFISLTYSSASFFYF